MVADLRRYRYASSRGLDDPGGAAMNAPHFNQIDGAALWRLLAGDDFYRGVDDRRGRLARASRSSADGLWRGSAVPFYQRLARWRRLTSQADIVLGLDDIEKIPVFDKADLMASIGGAAFGRFHGLSAPEVRPIVHTTRYNGRCKPGFTGHVAASFKTCCWRVSIASKVWSTAMSCTGRCRHDQRR